MVSNPAKNAKPKAKRAQTEKTEEERPCNTRFAANYNKHLPTLAMTLAKCITVEPEFRWNPELPEFRRSDKFGRSPFENSGVPEIADCTAWAHAGNAGGWEENFMSLETLM